eukprot:6529831-Alexandrium_andersonii.AAC.1
MGEDLPKVVGVSSRAAGRRPAWLRRIFMGFDPSCPRLPVFLCVGQVSGVSRIVAAAAAHMSIGDVGSAFRYTALSVW